MLYDYSEIESKSPTILVFYYSYYYDFTNNSAPPSPTKTNYANSIAVSHHEGNL